MEIKVPAGAEGTTRVGLWCADHGETFGSGSRGKIPNGEYGLVITGRKGIETFRDMLTSSLDNWDIHEGDEILRIPGPDGFVAVLVVK